MTFCEFVIMQETSIFKVLRGVLAGGAITLSTLIQSLIKAKVKFIYVSQQSLSGAIALLFVY